MSPMNPTQCSEHLIRNLASSSCVKQSLFTSPGVGCPSWMCRHTYQVQTYNRLKGTTKVIRGSFSSLASVRLEVSLAIYKGHGFSNQKMLPLCFSHSSTCILAHFDLVTKKANRHILTWLPRKRIIGGENHNVLLTYTNDFSVKLVCLYHTYPCAFIQGADYNTGKGEDMRTKRDHWNNTFFMLVKTEGGRPGERTFSTPRWHRTVVLLHTDGTVSQWGGQTLSCASTLTNCDHSVLAQYSADTHVYLHAYESVY